MLSCFFLVKTDVHQLGRFIVNNGIDKSPEGTERIVHYSSNYSGGCYCLHSYTICI